MSEFELVIKISDYNYLLNMPKEAWAWEFVRRDAEYFAAWRRRQCNGVSDFIINIEEMEEAAKFGLLFFR